MQVMMFYILSRTDKIDSTPFGLSKILCVKYDIYARLKDAVVSLTGGVHAPLLSKGRLKNKLNQKTKSKKINKYIEYEATDIWITRECAYWRWKRVADWYKKYGYNIK